MNDRKSDIFQKISRSISVQCRIWLVPYAPNGLLHILKLIEMRWRLCLIKWVISVNYLNFVHFIISLMMSTEIKHHIRLVFQDQNESLEWIEVQNYTWILYINTNEFETILLIQIIDPSTRLFKHLKYIVLNQTRLVSVEISTVF